jgi:hypothetical protein
MMVEPAALFPVVPTAMQSSGPEHEIPRRSTALAGGVWSDQVDPLVEVPITYGVELRLVPTAIQVATLGQSTELTRVPCGIDEGGVHVDRSTVLADVGPPPSAMPVATQFVEVAQDTAFSELTGGSFSIDQSVPF